MIVQAIQYTANLTQIIGNVKLILNDTQWWRVSIQANCQCVLVMWYCHVTRSCGTDSYHPSHLQPVLSTPKCRRNVENFLEACRRIGIAEVSGAAFNILMFLIKIYTTWYVLVSLNTTNAHSCQLACVPCSYTGHIQQWHFTQ